MNITFSKPGFLLLLFIIPLMIVLHSFSTKLFKKRALKFANFEAMSRIKGIEFLSLDLTNFYLTIAIFVFLIFSLAGTNYNYVADSSVASYMLVIDSSSSMSANDVLPSRFDAAKESALEFIDAVPSKTKIGLVTFSGIPYIDLEMTDKKSLIKDTIKNLKIKAVSGTNILDSLVVASNMLTKEETKAIILMSDGQINLYSLEEIIKYANKQNIIVYTFGIGTLEGGKTEINYISKIDEDALKSIAYNTDGKYFHITSKQQATQAFSEIAKKIRKKQTIEFSPYLLMIVFILIFIKWFLSTTRLRAIP